MISVLCPTRRRPKNLRRMIDSLAQTSERIPEVVCYVDEDDRGSYDSVQFKEIFFITGERIALSEMWNICASWAHGDILMMCADDVLFSTPNWDKIVEQAFEQVADKILFAFGDDGGSSGKVFGTLGFIHRKWYETVGYFAPPGFTGDWPDTWLNDVAKMIGRHQFIDIKTEHLHPIWNKAPMDETYREKYLRDASSNASKNYLDRLPERQRDAQKLRAVMV